MYPKRRTEGKVRVRTALIYVHARLGMDCCPCTNQPCGVTVLSVPSAARRGHRRDTRERLLVTMHCCYCRRCPARVREPRASSPVPQRLLYAFLPLPPLRHLRPTPSPASLLTTSRLKPSSSPVPSTRRLAGASRRPRARPAPHVPSMRQTCPPSSQQPPPRPCESDLAP